MRRTADYAAATLLCAGLLPIAGCGPKSPEEIRTTPRIATASTLQLRGQQTPAAETTAGSRAAATQTGASQTRRRAKAATVHPDTGTEGSESDLPLFSGPAGLFGTATGPVYQGLVRQADCSVSEVLINAPAISAPETLPDVQTIPHYEQYLHTLAGLTTKVDAFANGCKDPIVLGQTMGVVYLGKLSNGDTLGAAADLHDQAIVVAEITPANTVNVLAAYSVSGLSGLLSIDFNGDGQPDIAALSTPNNGVVSTLSIFLNNGDGTLKSGSVIALSGFTNNMVAGDFTGKGHNDLVLSILGTDSTSVEYFTSKGNGTFDAPVTLNTGASNPFVLLPYDINADGKLDIVSIASSGSSTILDVLLGNGDGTFTSKPSGFTVSENTSAMAAGDLNGDGKADLVFTGLYSDFLTIAEGVGDGTFTQKAIVPGYTGGTPYITDIDGDGNADIVLGSSSAGFFAPESVDSSDTYGQVLLGHGDFTFSVPAALPAIGTGSTLGQGQTAVAVADFNSDGKQDVAAAGSSASGGAAFIYLNENGVLTPSSTVAFGLSGTLSQIVAVDLNGDGKADLVAAGTDPGNGGSAIQGAINSGSGTFTTKTLLDVPAPITGMAAGALGTNAYQAVALVLNDGNYGPNNGLYVASGNDNGTFATPVLIDAGLNDGVFVLAADVNGDGKTDLVAVNSTGAFMASQVRVYLGLGAGKFAAPVSFFDVNQDTISSVTVADFNNDGSPDLGFVGNNFNTEVTLVYVYTGNKTASFTYATSTDASNEDATNMVAADFNGDGILDVVVDGCCGATTAQALIGKGGGAFYAAQPFVVPKSVNGVHTILLNSDTSPDLIFGYGEGIPGLVPVLNEYAAAPAVGKAATKTVPGPSYPQAQGEYAEVTAQVEETSGEGIPTGTVTLTVDGATYTTTLYQGSAMFSFVVPNIPAGTYTATLAYGGDLYNSPSTATLQLPVQYETATAFTVTPAGVVSGGTATLKATVTRPYGTGTPTGSVLFFYNDGNSVLASVELVDGVATLTAPTTGFPDGIYNLSALYTGDTSDEDSISDSVNVSLGPAGLDATATTVTASPATVTAGQTVTFTVAVSDVTHPSTTVTGNVELTVNGEPSGPFALSGGKLLLPIDTSAFPGGMYTLGVTYESSGKFYESAAQPLVFTLKYASTVELISSATTLKVGGYVQLYTFIGNTSSYPYPTGTVALTINGKALVTLPLSEPSYVLDTAGYAPGNYSVVATYSGDANNGAAASPPLVLTLQ